MCIATSEHFYRNVLWTVFSSLSLSIAGVCIARTGKGKVTPWCSDSSQNLEVHVSSWEASLIPAASRRRHCRQSKGGLQSPGSTNTQVNNVYKLCTIHSTSVNTSSSRSWIRSSYVLTPVLAPRGNFKSNIYHLLNFFLFFFMEIGKNWRTQRKPRQNM